MPRFYRLTRAGTFRSGKPQSRLGYEVLPPPAATGPPRLHLIAAFRHALLHGLMGRTDDQLNAQSQQPQMKSSRKRRLALVAGITGQ